jgi:hypothetical protein
MADLGKLLLLFGIVLVVLGALLMFGGRIPWLGRLPGDIYYKTDRVTVFFPLTTSILVSVVLSLLLWLFRR